MQLSLPRTGSSVQEVIIRVASRDLGSRGITGRAGCKWCPVYVVMSGWKYVVFNWRPYLARNSPKSRCGGVRITLPNIPPVLPSPLKALAIRPWISKATSLLSFCHILQTETPTRSTVNISKCQMLLTHLKQFWRPNEQRAKVVQCDRSAGRPAKVMVCSDTWT